MYVPRGRHPEACIPAYPWIPKELKQATKVIPSEKEAPSWLFLWDDRGGAEKETELTKRICVIDGQGGGIGATLIKYLKSAYGESIELIALGTNAIATASMLKAGANRGASGENAICRSVLQADAIVGPVGITWANAMLGEVTPRMAEAVMSSPAPKILLPLSQENTEIVGMAKEPLPHLVEAVVAGKIKEMLRHV